MLVHFSSLIPKIMVYALPISYLITYNFLDSGPNIPDSYTKLFFIGSEFTSITSHINNWVFFRLWLHLFILSRSIFPLISSSILGTYRPGKFIFQCPIFLHFHTVHGLLKARIMKYDIHDEPQLISLYKLRFWQVYAEIAILRLLSKFPC